ncbi:MAG: hypothetical protein KIS92_13640 [Planctomycetota bacterium]|nr:hypothetical protein [Planctomycetota bacterium]
MSTTPSSKSMALTLIDLKKVLGDALIIGGVAIGHYGHERATKDVDILYANWDTQILRRLEPYFKVTLKSESGWHHLKHRKTGVVLELVPEGGLTQYGFIPSPKTVGGADGFISLLGLTWLKMVSGRVSDLGDIANLMKIRMPEMEALADKLPVELRERYADLIEQVKKEMQNDPHRMPDELREAPAPYARTRRKPRAAKAKRKKLSA